MQAALGRSYKRWQAGEKYEKAREVMKHFFPSGHTSTGLNRRARVETSSIAEGVGRAIAAKKSETDSRSILLALKCNLPKEHSNGIRGVVNMPVSINSDAKVLVIAPPDLVERAQKAGAHIVGGAELIPDIISGKLKFNRCISTPQMMPVLTKVARFLGPLGLMPTIKTGTLTNDVEQAIKAAVNNVPFKIDRRAGIMHVRVGLLSSFDSGKLEQNVQTVFETISPYGKTMKKGKFIESAHLCVPAEPSIRIEPPQL